MNLLNRRSLAHGKLSRTRLAPRVLLSTFVFGLLAIPAHAVIIRGRVTDALGKPVPNARVQLIEKGQTAAIGFADSTGTYEIRSADAGRFTLLGSAGGFLPSIGRDFYAGATDVLEQDVVLSAVTVQQAISVSATDIPTPIPQLTAPVTVIPGTALTTQVGIVDNLRQMPGVFLAQTGQGGGVTSLFIRGGNSTANLVLVDGIPAEDVGGTFDYGTVTSTAIDRIEVYRGPDSAIHGTDAGAGVVTIDTPQGYTLKPVLDYSGDVGTLHSYRNEFTGGGTYRKLDYFGAFSRFDTSNALPNDKFHVATSAGNIGYSFSGNGDIRFTIRNNVAAQGLPGGYDFYGITNTAKQGDQDLFSGLTAQYRTAGNWHNLVRYGIARKREQQTQFGNVGNPITYDFGFGPFTEYFGNVVTIRGANGYSATGQAAFLTGSDDQSSNRDQLYYQSDWSNSPLFNVLFGFRYDNERGSYNNAEFFEHEIIQRTNYEWNLQFQGDIKGRFSYSLGGAIEKNHLYGIAGTPRIGFTYVPVRPSRKLFHGTRIRANFATGVQEPTLALEFNSLYTQLLNNGDLADIGKYHIGPQGAQRSRTYDFGVDQDIFGEKLVLRAGYFHNIFDHQLEGVSSSALAEYFGIGTPCPPDEGTGLCPLPSIFTAYVNSLAYRAQGAELELQWQPTAHIFVRGGYTYLSTVVLQSFASDAVAANEGMPTENPNIPGIPIGAEGPLVGARVFRRPPNTGYTTATYTRPKFSVTFLGAYASRSDDSTFLDGYDPNFGNSLILPNRDLDFGYAKLDLGGTYAISNRLIVFMQAQNLLNNQHIGPIGYPALPLTFRAGIKVRIGGD